MRRAVGVLVGCVLALAAALTTHAWPAQADPTLVVVDHGPTQGLPVPGAFLTADLGTWSTPPDGYDVQWLRDGVPIPGATDATYVVQTADVGHQLAPQVTAHAGAATGSFVGTPVAARRMTSALSLDVRRVHPDPTSHRLVWMAISYLTTERPWTTDGGTVSAYRRKDGHLRRIGSATTSRGAAFVRLPWKRAPKGRTPVVVCFQGSDAVAVSCSPYVVVRRPR